MPPRLASSSSMARASSRPLADALEDDVRAAAGGGGGGIATGASATVTAACPIGGNGSAAAAATAGASALPCVADGGVQISAQSCSGSR